jgi:hypothetical protein
MIANVAAFVFDVASLAASVVMDGTHLHVL